MDLLLGLGVVLQALEAASTVDRFLRLVRRAQEVDALHQLVHLVQRVRLHEQLLVFERYVVLMAVEGGRDATSTGTVLLVVREAALALLLAHSFVVIVFGVILRVVEPCRGRDRLVELPRVELIDALIEVCLTASCGRNQHVYFWLCVLAN